MTFEKLAAREDGDGGLTSMPSCRFPYLLRAAGQSFSVESHSRRVQAGAQAFKRERDITQLAPNLNAQRRRKIAFTDPLRVSNKLGESAI